MLPRQVLELEVLQLFDKIIQIIDKLLFRKDVRLPVHLQRAMAAEAEAAREARAKVHKTLPVILSVTFFQACCNINSHMKEIVKMWQCNIDYCHFHYFDIFSYVGNFTIDFIHSLPKILCNSNIQGRFSHWSDL